MMEVFSENSKELVLRTPLNIIKAIHIVHQNERVGSDCT